MATAPNEDMDEDVLELGEAPEDQDAAEINDQAEGDQGEDEALELPSFADDSEEEPTDTELVRHLRQQLRERDKRLSEVEKGQKQPEIVVGEKPTLESCEWDEEKFETELTAYHERKRKAEEQANSATEEQRKQNEIWQAKAGDFAQKRTAYPTALMNDCETALATSLNEQQRFAIVRYAKNAAALTVALGRSPAKLEALAKVTDLGEFIAATALLERDMKMGTRKPAAQPERIVRGSASMATAVDKEEERLEKEADKTGDRSKLVAYRREKKLKAK